MFNLPVNTSKALAAAGAVVLTSGLMYGISQAAADNVVPEANNATVRTESASHSGLSLGNGQHQNNQNGGQAKGKRHGSKLSDSGQHANGGQNHSSQKNHSVPEIIMNPEGTKLENSVEDLLTFLIQEEKMAYDLYTVIGGDTGLRQMQNISNSESRHIQAVRDLLAAYGLKDPTVGLEVGEFTDPAIQALYDELLAIGTDTAGAIEVGIVVEETDIADIIEMLEQDLPADVAQVLDSLLQASYNHLAAFNR